MIISTTITNSRERVIGKALAAIQSEVDVCIVIDTGANDATLAVVRQIVPPKKLRIFGFQWCEDFALARNYALFKAHAIAANAAWSDLTANCWAITADTDEVLSLPSVRERLAECSDDVVMVSHANGSYAQPRCIRLGTNVEWRDPVHEFLEGIQTSAGPWPEWAFKCQPRPEEDERARCERYLAIQEKLAPNQRRLYYLADTLVILNRIPEAIEAFLSAGRKPGWNELSGWAYFRAALLQHQQGDVGNALQSCMGGIILAPHVGELYVLAGSICMARNDYQAAQTFAMTAIQTKDAPRQGFSWPEFRYDGAARLLSMATTASNAPSQIQ